MTQLVCWAVPVRGGYVLRADRDTARAVRAARMRNPRFWGWRIAILQPGEPAFSAELARRPATLVVDYARLRGPSRPTSEGGGWARLRDLWVSLGLGIALVAISGGHWVPALAGAWLLAGRRWLEALLRLGPRPELPRYAPAQSVTVTAEPHTGLACLAALLAATADDTTAHARAESAARALDLADAAAVYAPLAGGEPVEALSAEIGAWVPRQALHAPGPAEPSAPETPAASESETGAAEASDAGERAE